MPKSLLHLSLALCLLIYGNTISAWQPSPTVILLSWDGMRWDYPDLAHFPGLQRMREQGLSANQLVPTFPSNTFPGHVSLATGTPPSVHGIIDNRFYDRQRGKYSYSNDASWIQAEPIWVTARRQGLRSAVYFWVGSETPWRGNQANYVKKPFDGRIGEARKVDQIIDWLDLPLSMRPQLIMSYWHGADAVGHKLGPNHTTKLVHQIRTQDQQLQRLLTAIDQRHAWPHISLILVSDHGMATVKHSIDLKTILSAGNIHARLSKGSTVAHLFLDNSHQRQSAFDFLNRQAHFKTYLPADLPPRLQINHRNRRGDIILISAKEYSFSQLKDKPQGMHGYDPKHPEMSAIFMAMGRAIPRGKKINKVHMLDVVPTVSHLLNIKAPDLAQGNNILDPNYRYRAPAN